MSEAYNRSVRLYWVAKKTQAPNREFNVESTRSTVHDHYHTCLRLLAIYSRTHDTSIVAYAIWGGRMKLGVKFHGKNVTVGVVKNGDVKVGVTREIKYASELQRYLETAMGFTIPNLNEKLFEQAYDQLKKIESETQMKIEPEETKKWSTHPYYRPSQGTESSGTNKRRLSGAWRAEADFHPRGSILRQ